MIALNIAKLKIISPGSEIFLWIKPKKEKKNLFVESLDQYRHLEVRQKARNVFFVMSLCLSDHKVLHNIHHIFIKFFLISRGFARFFRSYFRLQIFDAYGI